MGKRLALLIILTAALAATLAVGVAGAAPFVPSQTPDKTWNVSGRVLDSALSEDGSTLYIGGRFSTARKNPPGTSGPRLSVNNLAAIDVATGDVISTWNPRATGDSATVFAIAVKGDRVFVGGRFTEVGGQPRQNLAVVDAIDGSVDPAFDTPVSKVNDSPNAQVAPVLALLPGDTKLYIGGRFDAVDGRGRGHLAAVDIQTGDVDNDWRPRANNMVRDLKFSTDGASIFAAGKFTTMRGTDGVSETRPTLARVRTDNGNLHPWKIPANTIATPQQGWEIVVTPTTVYGAFGLGPNFAAAFRLNDLTNVNNGSQIWRFNTVGNVQTNELSEDGTRLFIGGHFGTNRLEQNVCGNKPLSGLLSLNPQTGAPLCDWVPQLAPSVNNTNAAWTLTSTPSKLWLGGGFTDVSGVSQPNVARFNYGPVNSPPRIDLNGLSPGSDSAANYTLGGGPQLVLDPAAVTVDDADDAVLRSATIILVDHPDHTSERLSIDTSGTPITASSYGYNSGRITLTGPATAAEFEQVLGTLKYRNNAASPTGTSRTVTFEVDDGEATSNTAKATLNFQ